MKNTIDGGTALTVRAAEYLVTVAGQHAPDLFCLVTDLPGDATYLAEMLAHAYRRRRVRHEAGAMAGPVTAEREPPHTRNINTDDLV